VAIGASHAFGRVVERTGSHTGHTAGLPVVVIVEAPYPPVVVHMSIQMHFVTAGAELSIVLTNKGLHERATVRLGVYINEKVVKGARQPVLHRRGVWQ